MARYSVAEAKNTLPRLIDRAIAGEEVVITRHGKPVVDIKARKEFDKAAWIASNERVAEGRRKGPTISMTAVQLLNDMYDETPW
ncbi:MAG: type II toxin-antitoxin system Phd/YefM family antitoxin [Janthinobacterium lividum]